MWVENSLQTEVWIFGFNCSSENEEIQVQEFSLEDTENDVWSLAKFAMPT